MSNGLHAGEYVQATVVMGLLLALALTVPLGAAIQARYRRAVHRLMRGSGGGTPPEPPPLSTSAITAPPPLPLTIEAQAADATGAAPASPASQRAAAVRRRRMAAYAVAGIAQALASTALVATVEDIGSPRGLAVIFYGSLWPVVLITSRLVPGARAFAASAIVYLLAPVAVNPWFAAAVYAFLIGPLFISLAVLAAGSRRLGAINPLVFAGLAVVGTVLPTALYGGAWMMGRVSGAKLPLFFATVAAMLALAGWLVWRGVRRMARGYQRGALSDAMLMVDAQWLVFSLAHGALMLTSFLGSGPSAGMATLAFAGAALPFVAYRVVLTPALAVALRGTAPEPGIPLLLLRTFGARRRSERLMRRLGEQWRYTGPIHLIAGDDLASANLEPHELFDFLGGRLDRRFARNEDEVRAAVRALDLRRDPDGRFRVNELFCRDDAWRMALREVAARSEPVLLDFRGFTMQNEGCIYELTHLASHVPMRRVLLVVDRHADLDALGSVLRQAWAAMDPASPNRAARTPRLRVVVLDTPSRRALDGLYAALLQAADPEPAPAPSPASPRMAAG